MSGQEQQQWLRQKSVHMGTFNDCYWLVETRRERLDGGSWFHWSEPLITRHPGFYHSPPSSFSMALANADGTDSE